MRNTYWVGLGMLAMELAIAGAPLARAQSQTAANRAASVSEASTMSAPAAPAEASPATPAAQAPTEAPATPQPLPTPSMTGPLQTAVPHTFDAGPLGQVAVTGILSGLGLVQGNWVPGDQSTQWDLANGQVFVQKTTGWWQFYFQGGAYSITSLGTPFISVGNAINSLYGPLPVGYLKLAPAKNTSILIGALPTVMGAEYTFDFENMNIERGLLWNQENAVNRGIQVNQTMGKFTASLSWNDGYYSNRYNWLSGALAYTNGPHSVIFSAMGNLGQTEYATSAAPLLLSNSSMYTLIYTYTKGNWTVQPYFQYSNVPTNPKIGIDQGASTRGGALLVNYNFKHGISLAGRGEYISSTGSVSNGAVNLIYGPGSGAWSFTVTPTYQNHGFFVRGDFSIVGAVSSTPGYVFGSAGLNSTQARGVMEAGFMF